jgi:diacylglycerol kinase
MPKKLISSFNCAGAGARHVLRTQRNARIHLLAGVLVGLLAWRLGVSAVELSLLVLTITLVIVSELFNTALEETINLIKPEAHPLAGLVKNIAAGAVLTSALGAVLVGAIIFLPRLAGVFVW